MSEVELSEEIARRIAKATRQVERSRRGEAHGNREAAPTIYGPMVRSYRVTSVTTTDGMYPCQLEFQSPDAGTFGDDTATTVGWLQPNGNTLTTGVYFALPIGVHTAASDITRCVVSLVYANTLYTSDGTNTELCTSSITFNGQNVTTGSAGAISVGAAGATGNVQSNQSGAMHGDASFMYNGVGGVLLTGVHGIVNLNEYSSNNILGLFNRPPTTTSIVNRRVELCRSDLSSTDDYTAAFLDTVPNNAALFNSVYIGSNGQFGTSMLAVTGGINAWQGGFSARNIPGITFTFQDKNNNTVGVVDGIIVGYSAALSPPPPSPPPPVPPSPPVGPSVTAVAPNSGPTTGSTTVTIAGLNLLLATNVAFGATAATFTVNSSTSITAVTPAESAGTVDVTVTTPAGTSTTTFVDQYTYTTPPPPPPAGSPTITTMSSHYSTLAGNWPVYAVGGGFASMTTGAVGATTIPAFEIYNDSTFGFVTPAKTAGNYDVTATNPNGTSGTSGNDTIQYVPLPTVTSVSPVAGSSAGGDSVTITGTNFVPGAASQTSVYFGNIAPGFAAPTIAVNSTTSIVAVTPAHAAAVVDVRVNVAGGFSAITGGDTFTFNPAHGSVTFAGSSGTWNTMVAGSHSITCVGSGQGGGSGVSGGGVGGGGGHYAFTTLTLSSGATLTYSGGAGGTGGASGLGGGGGATAWCSKTGSIPSVNTDGASAGGGGGVAVDIGTVYFAGGSGGAASGNNGGGGAGSATASGAGANGGAAGGSGGTGSAGYTGAGGSGATASGNGSIASDYGNGGGGSGLGGNGGNGSQSVVIIQW